ncbi:MAG TPA: DUF1080 domain-containing protein [Chitinophagaceae bacterium]|jgi:hypothetical protein|nr:DUF1080 domain-containing protein [Chitinophagaceae bacterium]
MKRLIRCIYVFAPLIMSAFVFNSANAQHDTSLAIEGRWDITFHTADGKSYPSWLEVEMSGIKTLVGRFVAAGGSARPVAKVNYADNAFDFTIPPQWESGNDITVKGNIITHDSLSGTLINGQGKVSNWTAVRAPLLKRSAPPVWGKTIKLFNGTNLDGWHAQYGTNQWVVENGVLKSPHSGANLMTDHTFTDFKLHIEFRYPKGSNSGVYLRGRYEVQVEDGMGMEPDSHLLGGVYGFLTPNTLEYAKPAGEWQSYDITLVGRTVTVAMNGHEVITRQVIPGITGGALNSNEGEPGPILLQGDHGPIEYRNITITPAK